MFIVVVLNDESEIIGVCDKLIAHKSGTYHLAYSILIINSNLEMLIQKRAKDKYHSSGLWSNACCSHPSSLSDLENSMHERLKYEMGIDTNLIWLFNHRYNVELDNTLIENELDYVYLGNFDGTPVPNVLEVDDWRWAPIDELDNEIKYNPEHFTPWFREIFTKYTEVYIKENLNQGN